MRLVVADDRPAESGELAGDRDRDDRATLPAPLIELPPDVVQALLGFPGDRDHRLLLPVLAALQDRAEPQWAALGENAHGDAMLPDQLVVGSSAQRGRAAGIDDRATRDTRTSRVGREAVEDAPVWWRTTDTARRRDSAGRRQPRRRAGAQVQRE